MEYGTKSWMGSYVDHHPGQEVRVIHLPHNGPRQRYGCALDEIMTPTSITVVPPVVQRPDLSEEREELGVDSRISDPDFEDSWEYFVDTMLGGDEYQALREAAKSSYTNKRAFVTNAVKAHKRRTAS